MLRSFEKAVSVAEADQRLSNRRGQAVDRHLKGRRSQKWLGKNAFKIIIGILLVGALVIGAFLVWGTIRANRIGPPPVEMN